MRYKYLQFKIPWPDKIGFMHKSLGWNFLTRNALSLGEGSVWWMPGLFIQWREFQGFCGRGWEGVFNIHIYIPVWYRTSLTWSNLCNNSLKYIKIFRRCDNANDRLWLFPRPNAVSAE